LPADPERRREPRYIGQYVVWWDDGNWEWIKCVNCGAELTTRESRERGCGPTCVNVVTEAAKQALLSEERINAQAYLEEKKRPKRARRSAPRKSRASIPDTAVDQSRASTPDRADYQQSMTRAKSKPKGITNEQAKELARLQRAAGEAYTGRGMTEREARAEIEKLRR
jgi:hypothetical protein